MPDTTSPTGRRRRATVASLTGVVLLVVLAGGTAPATAQAPPAQGIDPGLTLVGDTFTFVSGECTALNEYVGLEIVVTGTAQSGSVTGTFEETITAQASAIPGQQPDVDFDFTATLDDGRTIVGHKDAFLGMPGSYFSGNGCAPGRDDFFLLVLASEAPYTATTTDGTGSYTESGSSEIHLDYWRIDALNTIGFLDGVAAMTQTLRVGEPVDPTPFPVPDSKDDCKQDGWRTHTDHFGTPFKNQGDCVSYVATDGKNLADGPVIA